MNFKRLVSFVMAFCLAFSVSSAMAAKGGKSDKSGKGGYYSQKDDHSKKGRGKRGGHSGKGDGHSDKSGKNSGKSGKSGKSEKPTACVSDWEFIPDLEGESGFVEGGSITGTACTEAELFEIVDTEFSPAGAPDTVCYVDEELAPLPDPGLDGSYELALLLNCNTSTPPPPPPPAD